MANSNGVAVAVGTLVVVGAAAAMLYFATGADASDGTSDSAEDLATTESTDPSSAIQNFAAAIAYAEGYWDINENVGSGVLPVENNNPGDIGGGAATYGTIDEGWAALYAQLQLIVNGGSSYYDLSESIASMGATYANDGVNWPTNVVYFLNTNYGLGVTVDTPLSQVLS
jgi:hypothetical protein